MEKTVLELTAAISPEDCEKVPQIVLELIYGLARKDVAPERLYKS